MNSNCVSKMDLKVATSIFLSGLGYCEYIRLFSMLFEEDSLMCSNTFYSLQRSYIIPTIKEIWKRHQKFLIQKSNSRSKAMLTEDGLVPKKEKGIAEYLTEVLIDSVTHLVLGIETLCKDEKEEGKGNEEAQCLLKMLESPPIKDLKINELICDENKSVIKRIKEAKLPLEISLCIGHKGNTVRKKWRTKCKLKKTLSKNQLTKQGKKRKKPLYVYTHRHLEDLCKKIETHFKILLLKKKTIARKKKEEKSYKLAKKRRRKNKSKKEKEEDTRNEKVNMAGELDQNL